MWHTESTVSRLKKHNWIQVANQLSSFFNHWLERSQLQIKIHKALLFSAFPLDNETLTRNLVGKHLNRSLPSSERGYQHILLTLLTKGTIAGSCTSCQHPFFVWVLQYPHTFHLDFGMDFHTFKPYLYCQKISIKVSRTQHPILLPGCQTVCCSSQLFH